MSDEGQGGPRWAAGLEPGGIRRFQNLVTQELRARGVPFQWDEAGLKWAPEPGQAARIVRLEALVAECARRAPSDWSTVVHGAMASLLSPETAPGPAAPSPEGPDDAPPVLAPAPSGLDRGAMLLPPAPPRPAPRIQRAPRPERVAPPPDAPRRLPAPSESAEPASVPPPGRAPGLGRGASRWLIVGVGVVFAVTLALELNAFLREPQAPDLAVGPGNDVLVEATPAGKVMVLAEEDGRTLGRAPLRLLVPAGPRISVLLAAPGRIPQRLVLPSSGSVLVRLKRRSSSVPRCSLRLPSATSWQYQPLFGEIEAIENETIEVQGAQVVRVRPEGNGAWLVTCTKEGEKLEPELVRRSAGVADVRVEQPRGALLHVDERPVGKVPVRFRQSRAFALLRVRTVEGAYVARWVATTGSVGVRLPARHDSGPPLTVRGTDVESPVPHYLRRTRRSDEAAPLDEAEEPDSETP